MKAFQSGFFTAAGALAFVIVARFTLRVLFPEQTEEATA
jgi:hypothetical protein